MSTTATNWREQVERATVRLPEKGGQGVLVRGGCVLTAAHCIEWNCDGGMALGDHMPVVVEVADGRRFVLEAWAVEPCSDIAILGPPDDQVYFDEAEAWEAFYTEAEAVDVDATEPELFEKFPVHVRTHFGTWVSGQGQLCKLRAQLIGVEAKAGEIQCGTSGGPIVNDHGKLVGIVSQSSEPCSVGLLSYGLSPRPHRALPLWVVEELLGEQDDE